MEKDRSSRGTQQQFSIYSNKGGIIVKEEVSSEKAFTKAVKDICIDESSRPLMERNVSLNFDHSVVDGVIAIELAREPTPKNLSGPILSENDVSSPLKSNAPIKLKKLGFGDSDSGVDEGAVAQSPSKTSPTHETATANQSDSTTVENFIDRSSDTINSSPNDRKATDNDSDATNTKPTEVNAGTDTGIGEKPTSPSKEKTQNQVTSPMKSSVGNNTGDSGSGANAPSVPSTPSSPIPNSDCISNRSDSTSTSNRSFAFPVLPREWTSSPVKMEKTDKSRSRKCRGCSAIFCCSLI